MDLGPGNCLREAAKEQMRIASGTSCGREIEDFIPVAGDFRIHEEDGHLNRRRGTSAVVDNGGQSHISPVSRCSRLLITREFRPRTRVINGSRPSPRYRGTKLRANLPQPYINPDFLTLLSQRSPSSSSHPPPPALFLMPDSPVVQYNEPLKHASPCLDYSLSPASPTKLY